MRQYRFSFWKLYLSGFNYKILQHKRSFERFLYDKVSVEDEKMMKKTLMKKTLRGFLCNVHAH